LRGWEKLIKPSKTVSNPVRPKISTSSPQSSKGKAFPWPILKISWWESERGEVARERGVRLELGLVRMKWGWIENIPTEIPLKGVARGKTGQTGFRDRSDRFPSGNQKMVDLEILKLELRTNKSDMFKRSPVTSSFKVTPEASNLYPKTPFSLRER
jgi:hypothetical protein